MTALVSYASKLQDKRLIHYSHEPLKGLVNNFHQRPPLFKTPGFWVSDASEYGWDKWCKDEKFEIGVYETEVKLRKNSNIHLITDAEGIDDFSARYATLCEVELLNRVYGHKLPLPPTRHKLLDWERVRADYQGLVITPYIWERRLEMHCFWYYPWDCASGVIWDIEAIDELIPINYVNTVPRGKWLTAP